MVLILPVVGRLVWIESEHGNIFHSQKHAICFCFTPSEDGDDDDNE